MRILGYVVVPRFLGFAVFNFPCRWIPTRVFTAHCIQPHLVCNQLEVLLFVLKTLCRRPFMARMVAQKNSRGFQSTLLEREHVLDKHILDLLEHFSDPTFFKKKSGYNVHGEMLGKDGKMIVKVSHKETTRPVRFQVNRSLGHVPVGCLVISSPNTCKRFTTTLLTWRPSPILQVTPQKTEEEKAKLSWYRKVYEDRLGKHLPSKRLGDSIEARREAYAYSRHFTAELNDREEELNRALIKVLKAGLNAGFTA